MSLAVPIITTTELRVKNDRNTGLHFCKALAGIGKICTKYVTPEQLSTAVTVFSFWSLSPVLESVIAAVVLSKV